MQNLEGREPSIALDDDVVFFSVHCNHDHGSCTKKPLSR